MKPMTMKTTRFTRSTLAGGQYQRGASLLLTVMVLLGLTVIALGVTTSNQTQSIMVRNNQFRLESFNVSHAEIDAQVDALNTRRLSDGVPTWLIRLIDGNVDERVYSSATDVSARIDIITDVPSSFMEQELAQVYRGNCLVFGQQAGEGSEKIRCNEVVIESDASMADTEVNSDQRQVYEYLTLEE